MVHLDSPSERANLAQQNPSSFSAVLHASTICSCRTPCGQPDRASVQTASANLVLNNHVNVELHHAAAGHRAGSITMAAVEQDAGRAIAVKEVGLPQKSAGLWADMGCSLAAGIALRSDRRAAQAIGKIDRGPDRGTG